jgi:hypothetical protein
MLPPGLPGEVGKPKLGLSFPRRGSCGAAVLNQTRCPKPGHLFRLATWDGFPEVAGRFLRQAIFPTRGVPKRRQHALGPGGGRATVSRVRPVLAARGLLCPTVPPRLGAPPRSPEGLTRKGSGRCRSTPEPFPCEGRAVAQASGLHASSAMPGEDPALGIGRVTRAGSPSFVGPQFRRRSKALGKG